MIELPAIRQTIVQLCGLPRQTFAGRDGAATPETALGMPAVGIGYFEKTIGGEKGNGLNLGERAAMQRYHRDYNLAGARIAFDDHHVEALLITSEAAK